MEIGVRGSGVTIKDWRVEGGDLELEVGDWGLGAEVVRVGDRRLRIGNWN